MKPAFRQTKIGVIPDDWDTVSLGAIVEPSAPIRYGLVQVGPNTPDGIPIVPIKHLQDIGRASLHRAAKSLEKRYARSRILEGDVLLSVKGTIGHIGIAPKGFSGNIAREIARIRVKNGVFPDFIAQQLACDGTQQRILRSIVGTTRQEFSIAAVRRFEIALPRKDEQRAIAEALGDADALLGALDRLIAKKRDLKQAAMQQLLTGQTRLPGFSGGWEDRRLGDLGWITGAGVDKKVRVNEVPVRLLNYMDVYRNDLIRSGNIEQSVTARSDQATKCTIEVGDVFFTPTSEVRDDIAHSAVAVESIPGAVYSYHLVRLRLNVNWDIRFRSHVFKTKAFLDQASTLCEGSGTRYVITLPKFRSMVVRAPIDVAEQRSIAAVLSDMDAEVNALEQRRAKTAALKQGMMQKLLTGRTRLV